METLQDILDRGTASVKSWNHPHVEADPERRAEKFIASVPETLRWAARASAEEFPVVLSLTAPHVLGRRAQIVDVASCPMMLIAGKAGSGKTVLAIARTRKLVDAGAKALFVDALQLALESKAMDYGRACKAVESAKAFSGVLILDDLGQDLAAGPAARVAAIDVVRTRSGSGRKTIITTGFTREQLREQYDHAFVRRISERGRATVIRLDDDGEGST